MNVAEKARAKLMEHLDEKNRRRYEKYGIVKVVGKDGFVYFVANSTAMDAHHMARVTREYPYTTYCRDILLPEDEKVLVFMLILKTKPSILTSGDGVSNIFNYSLDKHRQVR